MNFLTGNSLPWLSRCPLFAGADAQSVLRLLRAMDARAQQHEDGAVLLRQGQENGRIFIVALGVAVGEHITADGRAVIVNEMAPGDVFGDVLSGSGARSPVQVTARGAGRIISFSLADIFAPCPDCRGVQELLLRNLIGTLSEKYFALNRRVELLLKRTLRARAAAYLLQFDTGGRFIVPHSREEQSRFLGCERSALSRELSNMRRDGLIDYRKNRFLLLDRAALEKLAQ
ncbi:MAG: Crp/Fnr family transcriptional regulator [Oscillospiraceae bacterium]|nr:Crp/Fnr family transcriptional regulator [Oscillospiraceae bacterium]